MSGNGDTPALTLELGPDKVPAHEFESIVKAFAGLLDVVSEQAFGDPRAAGWQISVERGSVQLAADPADMASVARVHAVILKPERALRRRLRSFPRNIPATRLLVGEERFDALRERPEEPERHPSQLGEYGTVEGTLDTLSVRGGPHFTISEPIWNMAVRCIVPEQMVEAMRAMWKVRVSARGMVHYDREGHPTSIRADEVTPFPYDETPIEEYRGLYVAE